MKAIILKAKPGMQLRLGEGGKDSTSAIIHSDTLFSAITNIYESVYNEGDKFIDLIENKKIKISSCFPCFEKDGSYIYFVPKPEVFFKEKEGKKKFKKTNFISLRCLNIFLGKIKQKEGGDCFIESELLEAEDIVNVSDEFMLHKEEAEKFFKESINSTLLKTQTTPKNMARYEKQEDTIYYETNIQLNGVKNASGKYEAKTHYYFFLEEELDENNRKKLYTVLNILADEGLGGERSTGKGIFEETLQEEIDIKNIINNNYYYSLSLINPKNEEEAEAFLSYQILKRGGGSTGVEGNPVNERKQVRMIREGAILNKRVCGRIVDISPDNNFYKHNIFRNGMSFIIQ